ncbi:hypothetical protein KY386_03375 [Candidatus Parcubacteria bacterium]|nr:hypothetical protein [Candidatus Parcubacteria bacterium]
MLGAVSGPARAAAVSGVSVTPALKEVTLAPGQPQEAFLLSVRNNTPAALSLRLSVVDFGVLDETGGVAFLGETSDLERRYGLAAWAKLDRSTMTLPPGANGKVKLTINNQETLTPGGHYGAVLFKVDNGASKRPEGQKVTLNQVFSSLILVKKVGGERYGLSLAGHDSSSWRFNLPNQLQLRFSNPGNVHVTPTGTIKLIDPLGREVARGTINPEAGRILPESFRLYRTKLKSTASAWLPGYYRTQISYGYDAQTDRTLVQSKFMLVNLPLVPLLVVLLLVALWLWHRGRTVPAVVSNAARSLAGHWRSLSRPNRGKK